MSGWQPEYGKTRTPLTPEKKARRLELQRERRAALTQDQKEAARFVPTEEQRERYRQAERDRMNDPEASERRKEHFRAFRQSPKGKEAHRRGHLKQKYGMTVAEYEAMNDAQGGVCVICGLPYSGMPFSNGHRRLYVDHDHKTHKIRGLLCRRCNLVLGEVGDDWLRLLRMATYLLEHGSGPVNPLTPEQVTALFAEAGRR